MQEDGAMRTRNWIIGAVIVVVLAVIAVFVLRREAQPEGQPTPVPVAAVVPSETPESTEESREVQPEQPMTASEEARRRWESRMGFEPEWPVDLNAPQDCERVQRELQRLCVILDANPDLRELADGYGSCDLLSQATNTLALRPPRISAELRSYETMLSNVFHLSRILGRKPLRYPGKLLAEEQELAEPLALATYRWAISREQCSQSTPLDGEVLYDYAGFLFNTMGGQAYMRRRSPRVEGLTCFYALQIVDGAQQRGFNPDGLDPRKEIARCRALLELQPLVFQSEYLANLEDMLLRWEARAR